MTGRRAVTIAVLGGLAAAGFGLYALTRVWESGQRDRPAPLPPHHFTHTGDQLAGWAVPSGVVALAGVVALLATAGLARRLIAILNGLAGAGLAIGGIHGLSVAPGPWPAATLVCGLAVVAIAAWTLRDGGNWPAMSGRYDRATAGSPPRTAIADDPAAMWDALDRGVDPTSPTIGQTAPGEECAR
jgi:hypothetical protein